MDEVDLILEDTFFETHTVDVRRKPVRLVVCRNGKKVIFKLTRTPMAGGGKLNSVSIDQMTNELGGDGPNGRTPKSSREG